MTKHQKGILFIIFSAFSFSLMNMFVKLAGDLPSIQKSFFRNLIALMIAAVLLKKEHIPLRWKKENFGLFILRSAFGTLGILCNFYAVSHMNLADASMLNKLSPFFALIFSFLLIGEKVKPAQAACAVLAFLGSLCIIKPTFNFVEILPAILGFLGGVSGGIAYTAVRMLGLRGEKGPFIVFFFSAFSCIVTLPYLIFAYTPMTTQQLIFLLLAGIAASGGQFGVTAAYTNAPAREISIYDYSIIIFSSIWSFLVWSDMPDWLSFLGYVIIFGASFMMFRYNKKHSGS